MTFCMSQPGEDIKAQNLKHSFSWMLIAFIPSQSKRNHGSDHSTHTSGLGCICSGILGYTRPGIHPHRLMPFSNIKILYQHVSVNLTFACHSTAFLPLFSCPKPQSHLRSYLCHNQVALCVMEWIKDETQDTIVNSLCL